VSELKEVSMTTTVIDGSETRPQRLSPVVRLARLGYALSAALFAGAIALEVFFAGLGALADPAYWSLHRAFGPVIGLIAIALPAVGLVGRLPWRMLGPTVLLFPLFAMQFVFLYAPVGLGLVELRALHVVNALVLFWAGTHLARRAVGLLRSPGDGR
jgi:uncharacterized protein DUF6220